MSKREQFINFVIDNEFITKPSLQDRFAELLDESIKEAVELNSQKQKLKVLQDFSDQWNNSKIKEELIFERDINSFLKGDEF